MKQFNNNTDDDDTYDGKIRGKGSDIRMMLSVLGNTVTQIMMIMMIERKLEKSFMK